MSDTPKVPGLLEGRAVAAYRRDIDGLRAIAVLAVVAFHAFPQSLPGGFVGVDIFFVVSGYLITAIVLGTLRDGIFTFGGFYVRRIRRIFPALIVVLMASAVLGWFILVPLDFASLGKQIVGAAGFASNFVLWNEAGYFDALSIRKPLLHLWSLGIEEQFYLVWPLLLWFWWKCRLSALWPIAILSVFSFATNIVLTTSDPIAAFYSPFSRVWELGVGGLLASLHVDGRLLIAGRHKDAIISLFGLAMIGAALILIDNDSRFPGWWALLPVTGTCLVILAGRDSLLSRWLLENQVLVGIGLISYPLYLWHWVLLSFAFLTKNEIPTIEARIGLVALSVILAGLTYFVVERPIRFGPVSPARTEALAASLIGVAIIGGATYSWGGIAARFPSQARSLLTYNYDATTDSRAGECWIVLAAPADGYKEACLPSAADRKPNLFIWGDSHAGRLRPGIERIYGGQYHVTSATRDSCPPKLLNSGSCEEANRFVLSVVKRAKPDVVLLDAAWSKYNEDVVDNLLDLTRLVVESGVRRIIVVGPAPFWNGNLPNIMYEAWAKGSPLRPIPRRLNTGLVEATFEIDQRMRAITWGSHVEYVSLINMLCNDDGCLTYVPGSDEDLMTWDYGHLTTPGAAFVARGLRLD